MCKNRFETPTHVPMQHPNPRPSTNQSQSSFTLSEKIFCSLLLIVGILGLQSVMVSAPKNGPSVLTPSSPHQSTPVTPAKDLQKAPPLKGKLQITGYFEAEEEVTFRIPNFYELLSYELELGNNKTLKVKNEYVKFTYPKQGKYEVKLWVIHNGERKLLDSREITINEAIKVSDNAFVEFED